MLLDQPGFPLIKFPLALAPDHVLADDGKLGYQGRCSEMRGLSLGRLPLRIHGPHWSSLGRGKIGRKALETAEGQICGSVGCKRDLHV